MSEWKEDILGNHVEVINGYAFKSSNFLEQSMDNSMPVVKIKNVANGDVHLNGAQYHKYDNTFERFIVSKGDVLIALTGNHPYAITQVVGEVSRYKLSSKALLNQRVAKIVSKDGLNNDFLYYLLKEDSTHDYLANQSSGSANQANISKGDIEGIPIQLPSLPEQIAIASILSSLDDKIDLLHRQNAILEKMAETLFKQWFVDEAKAAWEEKPLSSIAKFLNGLACQKFPPKNDTDKLPVLKIKDLSSGITENSDWATAEIPADYIVDNGDVIFAWSASLMVKIWNGDRCVLNQHLFKVTSEDFSKWFYYLWCKHHLEQFIAIAKAHATTMGHIKRGDLDEAKVLIPSSQELAVMTEQVEPLIERIITNNIQINTLTKLRDLLLPRLMSGEVKIN